MNKTKKWLALGFSLLSISLLVACGNSQKKILRQHQKKFKPRKRQPVKLKKKINQLYSIGDTITFDKHAEYTITNVEWTDERNEFDNTNQIKF